MAGGLLRFDVDPGNVLARRFTALEQKLLPDVARKAALDTGIAMRERWAQVAGQVFDRPTGFTVKSPRYKLVPGKYAVDVYINDAAGKGTPPSKYLLPQVIGGARPEKGLESALKRLGLLHGSERAVPGKGAPLNAYGNIRGGIVQQVLAQLGANREVGSSSNETPASRARNAQRGTRKPSKAALNRRYFAVRGSGSAGYVVNKDGSSRTSHLRPGIYQRVGGKRSPKVRSIFMFVRGVSYRKRFDIFTLAQKIYTRQFPFHFERELGKALQNAAFRGLK